jgi:ribosomal protein S18 acetylase RimI-like enzyme
MTIHLRDTGAGDKGAIVALIRELAASSGDTSPITEDYVSKYLATPRCHALLAEVDGQAVGLLTYSVRPDLYHAGPTASIDELVVRGEWRGQGVGSALVQEVLRRAATDGWVEVSVTTLKENEAAQRFYRAHGLADEAVFLEAHLEAS